MLGRPSDKQPSLSGDAPNRPTKESVQALHGYSLDAFGTLTEEAKEIPPRNKTPLKRDRSRALPKIKEDVIANPFGYGSPALFSSVRT